MFRCVVALLTLTALLAHAVLGSCAHQARGAESAPADLVFAPADGEHHDGDPASEHERSCQFVKSADTKLPEPASQPHRSPLARLAALDPACPAEFFNAAQAPPVSMTGCPCALRVQQWTQVWLL